MSSGFITEAEIADIRKKRQEEWEKVRKAEDPLERPEESYDNRSLFERLQEQKQKKDIEYEEAHKLKNMIKGLDDDEIEFLDLVDRTKLAADRKKELEEERELNDYRNRVAILQEKTIEERLQADIVVNKTKSVTHNRTSQQKLMKGIVIKKSEPQKRKMSDSSDNDIEQCDTKQLKTEDKVPEKGDTNGSAKIDDSSVNPKEEVVQDSALKCVAILPGLGCYGETSSEENSSDSDVETCPTRRYDMLGRKLGKKKTTKDS